jgi:phage shock protein PspC (stress-responsive transcriptional regulator)
MKKLLDLLRSDRPLVAGAFARLSNEFGLDRVAVRIIGFLILWAGPYLLGASYRAAWIFSILGYIALMIFARRLDRSGSRLDRRLTRRWRARVYGRFGGKTDCNGYPSNSQVDSVSHGASEMSTTLGQPSTATPVAAGPESGQQIGDALSELEQRLARLDQRIQKMETAVTDRAFDWDRRLRKG